MKVKPWKRALATSMRRHMTWPEKKLWARLKNNQTGVRWYSQRVLCGYIADFYCVQAKLCLEADGKHHLAKDQVVYDRHRDEVMAKQGIKTIRFTAQEIANNLPAVMVMIQMEIEKRL